MWLDYFFFLNNVPLKQKTRNIPCFKRSNSNILLARRPVHKLKVFAFGRGRVCRYRQKFEREIIRVIVFRMPLFFFFLSIYWFSKKFPERIYGRLDRNNKLPHIMRPFPLLCVCVSKQCVGETTCLLLVTQSYEHAAVSRRKRSSSKFYLTRIFTTGWNVYSPYSPYDVSTRIVAVNFETILRHRHISMRISDKISNRIPVAGRLY